MPDAQLPMRILHVAPSVALRTGGFAAFVLESAIALCTAGHECTVYATDQAQPPATRPRRRLEALELPIDDSGPNVVLFPARTPQRISYSPSLTKALRRNVTVFDVVHIHSLFLHTQFVAFRAATATRTPYIVAPHGALDPYLRRRNRTVKALADRSWQRNMLERASALHMTTAEEARLTRDIAPGTPRAIVPCGVNTGQFQERLRRGGSFRERYLIGQSGPLILNVGRLSHKKGLDVLIRAFARVMSSRPDAWLVLAGPDDEGLGASLVQLAAKLGVDSRVVLTGMLTREGVADGLAESDVWALPSLTENFGVAVVEAMAAGVPVVISPQVNLAPEIERSSAGIIAAPTPTSFGSALVEILEDDTRRAQLCVRGRQFASRYDWRTVVPELVSMYEGVARTAPER